MATFAVRQVLPQSVDDAGISTVTATTNTADPRTGQMYRPDLLAAAAPVWFHRLPGGRYAGLFARRLINAAPADPQPGGPLVYRTATDFLTPSWAVFDPATGAATDIGPIPTDTEGQRVLRAAVSRGDYLFVLSTIGDSGLLQHFRVGSRQALVLQAEEITPGGLGLGLHIEGNDLWLFGDKDGMLTLARKNWGRVGENASRNPFLRWRYRTARGWSFDLADLAPLAGNIPTSGPVSVARHRTRYYLTMPVYAAAGGTWSAKTWSSRAVDRQWTPHPFTVPLGTAESYTGGTAYLQPQLALTPGYTRTETHHGQTDLDGGSDPVQVFTGIASQVVRLPAAVPASRPPYTLHNKTIVSSLIVQTASGAPVATVAHGRSLTLTPTADTPTLASQWTQTVPADRTPPHRTGFPYVVTTALRTAAGHRTLVTSWGAFEV